MKKKIVVLILILLAATVIGFYVFDIVANDADPTENLLEILGMVLTVLAAIIGIFYKKGGRKTLRFYELRYKENIKDAFINAPDYRKKLLSAIRYYNENKYKKAAKILRQLMSECSARDDYEAVGVFLALIFTDMKLYGEAVPIYEKLIDMGIVSSTIYCNLGYIYSDMGKYDEAVSCYTLAMQYDPKDVAVYNNFANMYFRNHDFDNAKIYAQQALTINQKFGSSISLLAIIYSLEGDTANTDKYFHMAVSSGRSPGELKEAIEYYKAARLSGADTKD